MSTSKADRDHLAPVDVGIVAPFMRYIRGVFANNHQDALTPRARATGLDMNPRLGHGYYNAQGEAMRGAASGGVYNQGKRGQMANIPTPQELIRQVTGVGDLPSGR